MEPTMQTILDILVNTASRRRMNLQILADFDSKYLTSSKTVCAANTEMVPMQGM